MEQNLASLTLTSRGCGTMGVAILSGISSNLNSLRLPGASCTRTPTATLLPTRFHYASKTPTCLPTRSIACIKRPKAACQVGEEEDMCEALEGKLLARILAGVEVSALEEVVPGMIILGWLGLCQILEYGTASKGINEGYMREIVSVITARGRSPSAGKDLVSWIQVLSAIGCSLLLG
ncbi:unnamed protein product [Tuber aestivum]|uniref:Uncharacterized protein n=1 Tax=Tuber aestivum TaxID=59557 RepID=A0A292Q1F5_9PEZI|nr:unnamed protein product [Tuber aestivum]